MRVEKIQVKKLFGIFDHVVPLNLDERITIAHGPNGFGKTVLLRMLSALFKGNYLVFYQYPFDEFSVSLDERIEVHVVNHPQNRQLPLLVWDEKGSEIRETRTVELEVFGLATDAFRFTLTPLELRSIPPRMIDDLLPMLQRAGSESWRVKSTGEILSYFDVILRYNDLIPLRFTRDSRARTLRDRDELDEKSRAEREKWEELRAKVKIRLIDTTRLQPPRSTRRREDETDSNSFTVNEYATELAENIKAELAKYADMSQSLDRTFPIRLVQQLQSSSSSKRNASRERRTYDELRNELNKLEQKRLRLESVGLLDQQPAQPVANIQIPEPDDVSDPQKELLTNVLSIYVEDVKRKLSVFDAIASKIDLFNQIIHKRFQYKQMQINKEEGFVFKSSDEKPLARETLSSGEQHELVLLYELLFRVEPNSLILIDEPEISLHIAWQQEFLKDLQEMTYLSHFDVLIATHSPDIIYDRQDLMVALTGPHVETSAEQ